MPPLFLVRASGFRLLVVKSSVPLASFIVFYGLREWRRVTSGLTPPRWFVFS